MLRREVPAAWSIALTTVACVLLAAGVGRLIGELIEISAPPDGGVVEVAVPAAPAAAAGRIVGHDGEWRVELTGAPGALVLVEAGEHPVAVVRLDDNGRAALDLPALPEAGAAIRVSSLAGPPVVVGALPAATAAQPRPAATATPSPAAPRRSPSPTSPAATAPQAPAAATRTVAASPEGDEGADGPPVLHLVADGGPRLALTFDGAGSANGTADLLEMLRDLRLEVTLFVTGEFIDRHPGLVRRAALAGHEFGNHTYSHPHLTSYASNHRHDLLPAVTRELLQRELLRTEKAFRDATGRPMAPLWRAPYGEENRQLRGWAMELGYLHVRWSSLAGASLDSLDWVEDEHSSLYVDSGRLIERLLEFPRLEGGIVLMHLSTNRRVPPWTELPRFTDEVRGRGLQIGTVSALLEASPQWRPWYQRARERHMELSARGGDR